MSFYDSDSNSDSNDYNNGEYISQETSCCYIYKNKKLNDDYYISITNYGVEQTDEITIIISNYFICDNNNKSDINIFATVIWEDIKYINNNYNPFSYDPDPIALLYRDDWDSNKVNKYLQIINKLSNKFFSPTTEYKHFNPNLPKIPLSKLTDEKCRHITEAFKEIMDSFNNNDT